MSNHSTPIATILTTLTLLLVSACGKGAGMQPTMTIAEANRKVDQYITDAVAQIPGKTELDERLRFEESDCSDPDDHGPLGRKIAEREYEILNIDPTKISSYFDTLKAWWSENGYTVYDDRRPHQSIRVENNKDGVRLSLQTNDQRRLVIIASSPCVWPNGTPQPE